MVKPRLDLAKCAIVEAEFDVAKTHVAKFDGDDKTNVTTVKLLHEQVKHLR